MRLTLAIKTLFRSPVKTLLTFVLLAATSFMFTYSTVDYALTTREFQRTVGNYRGIFSVEYGTPARPDASDRGFDDNRFLLSEELSPVSSDELYVYDDFHHKGLSKLDIGLITSFPFVTTLSLRYMTAGISPDYYRIDNVYSFFNYPARFIFEATLSNIEADNSFYAPNTHQKEYNIYISDIKVLAGDSDWLLIPHEEMEDNQIRIHINVPNSEFYEYFDFVRVVMSRTRWSILFRQNNIGQEQLDSLIPGKRYIFVGRTEPKFPFSQYHFCIGDDTLIDWWPYIYPLEGQPDNYMELDEFAPLRELIQITNEDLQTFDVVYTEDMETIRRVRDEKILPVEGRFLAPEDSKSKNRVCVVSDIFMKEYGLELGDTVKLKLGNELFEQYAPLGAVASARERYADKFVDTEFEIIGSYLDININKLRDPDLYWAYSDNTIFVPLPFLLVEQSVLDEHEFKPGELSFVVGDARNIRTFVDECIPELEEMGLTVYFSDGGWLRIEEQVMQAGSLSMSKLFAFAAASAMAMALTVYLFIGRKKREYAIMRALGTTKRRASRALFVPLALLALLAIILGSAAATVYAGRTVANTLKTFVDLGLDVDTSLPVSVVILGVVGELVLLLLLTAFGLYRIGKKPPLLLLQESTNKNAGSRKEKIVSENMALTPISFGYTTTAKAAVRIPSETEKYNATYQILRYITKHSRRALLKSLLSIMLATLLTGALGQFTAVRGSYEALYNNIDVKARFVNGMPFSRAQKVAESGYVHSPYYEYIHKEGEANFERAEIYMTSDIERVTNAPIEFLEGYDEDTVMMLRERICVLPSRFMEMLDLELGDEVALNEWNYLGTLRFDHPEYTEEEALKQYHRRAVDCKIVGRIISDSAEQTAYVPVMAEDYFVSVLGTLSLDLAEYVLEDYHQADEFRTYAKETVDSIRSAPPLFIMDTSEADNIYKIYRLIETLYPIAAIAAISIGSILPGLIILQSAKDASIMRVLGTTKRRTRLMLVLEQLMLCLSGLIFALVILAVINGRIILKVAEPITIYCALHFAGCAIGASVCAIFVTKRKILELLQVKE